MNRFSLKNFRVFDHNEGATFNIAPITILTGCNSSGKSSVVKAMLLLRDFFGLVQEDKGFEDCKLDFGNSSAKLGSFDNARNINSRKGSKMTFAYTVNTRGGFNLLVQLTFGAEKADTLNNGYLCDLLITEEGSGEILLELHKKGKKGYGLDEYVVKQINLNLVKRAFIADAIWKTALDVASYITPSYEDENPHKGKLSQSDLDRINEILEFADNYMCEDEVNRLVDSVRGILGLCEGVCNLHTRQVVGAAKYNIIHSYPVLDWVANVPKSEVRDVINDRITAAEKASSKEFPYRDMINEIVLAFEKSDFEEFADYLRDIENDAFCIHGPIGSGMGILNTCRISVIGECIYYSMYCYCNQNSGNKKNSEPWHGYIFDVLLRLSEFTLPDYDREIAAPYDTFITTDRYDLFVKFVEFYESIVREALCPIYMHNFEYVGDSAINIQRLYTTELKDEFGETLFRYLEACRKNQWSDIEAGEFIDKWVKNFGLGDHIRITQEADGLGATVRLYKTADDKRCRLLADEGLGVTKLVGTIINIEAAILSAEMNGLTYRYFKGTQRYRPKRAREVTTLAIEEPENHLHPKYQALLADMIADAYKNYKIHFIVETHSEYIVRKLQTLVARKELSPEEVSLQYVYNADSEKRPKGEPHVKSIGIREDGTLIDTFGPGFFDEADNLAMDLLTIKAMG